MRAVNRDGAQLLLVVDVLFCNVTQLIIFHREEKTDVLHWGT